MRPMACTINIFRSWNNYHLEWCMCYKSSLRRLTPLESSEWKSLVTPQFGASFWWLMGCHLQSLYIYNSVHWSCDGLFYINISWFFCLLWQSGDYKQSTYVLYVYGIHSTLRNAKSDKYFEINLINLLRISFLEGRQLIIIIIAYTLIYIHL